MSARRVGVQAIAAAALLLGFACSHPTRSMPAESVLEHAIRFEEVPMDEAPRELSERKGERVVPSPGALDWNSRLRIEIDRDKLAELALPSDKLAKDIDQLATRRDQLITMLKELDALMGARAAALKSYADLRKLNEGEDGYAEALAKATELFNALDTKAEPFMLAADTYFSGRDPAVYGAALDAIDTFGKDLKFQELVQAELDGVAAELTRVRAEAVADGFELRIEAYLDGPESALTPVHVDGYDRLPEGKLERRDRLGLALEGAALERYDNLTAQSKTLATTLEGVRTGQTKLVDALASMTGTVLGAPAAVVAEGLVLKDKLAEVPTRLGATKTAADKFKQQVSSAAEGALKTKAESARSTLDTELDKLQSALKTQGITQLIADATRLAELLRTPRPESFPEVQSLLMRLPVTATEVANGITSSASDSVAAMITAIESLTTGGSNALNSTALALWEKSELKEELEKWKVLAREVEGFVNRLSGLAQNFNLGGVSPIPADLRNSESIDVPFAEIRDTWVDLRRTPRLEGDTLTVRVTPLQAGRDLGSPLSVPFQVEQYGWHARLDPSVVLARPTSLGTGQERFQFAPMLSWSHTYTPRPEDDDWVDDFFRKTGFSLGPHATFLNTTDESDLEIGLGVTAGLWDGVLLFGLGWNLGADRDADGDYYFVIGSSLVSLLQKFQEGS